MQIHVCDMFVIVKSNKHSPSPQSRLPSCTWVLSVPCLYFLSLFLSVVLHVSLIPQWKPSRVTLSSCRRARASALRALRTPSARLPSLSLCSTGPSCRPPSSVCSHSWFLTPFSVNAPVSCLRIGSCVLLCVCASAFTSTCWFGLVSPSVISAAATVTRVKLY